MAWLHAKPKPDPRSRRAQTVKDQPLLSRAEKMRKEGVSLAMPPNPLPHMLSRLIDIGLSEPAGMGAAPISWVTIDAWQRATGVDLEPWEARLLRTLSREYVAEGQRAEDEACPPPWHVKVTAREVATETARLRAFFS